MSKKLLILSLLTLVTYSSHSQYNMLGKSQKYIRSFYKLTSCFSLKIDTISDKSVLLTYKTAEQYPFFTYELDLKTNLCVSYGIVSRDTQILETYLDMLAYIGELMEADSHFKNFRYKIETKDKTSYFTIKQPYVDSPFLTRRNVFYILMTEEKHYRNDVGLN